MEKITDYHKVRECNWCNRCARGMVFTADYCPRCIEENEKTEEYKAHFDELKSRGYFNVKDVLLDCARGKLTKLDVRYATGLSAERIHREFIKRLGNNTQ